VGLGSGVAEGLFVGVEYAQRQAFRADRTMSGAEEAEANTMCVKFQMQRSQQRANSCSRSFER
jgi:hypothetical protein